MIYLVIMVLVAAAGITRLWYQQHKDNARVSTVDGFRESLERIAAPTDPESPNFQQRSVRRMPTGAMHRMQPLDPARRAAAKRRIAARRRARQPVA